jgi:phenylalanine-4-hydroxylase
MQEPSAARHLVPLSADHPGFTDAAYRARRDALARLALDHRPGAPVPRASYSAAEQRVWRCVWWRLAPLHRARVCAQSARLQETLGLARGPIPQLEDLNRVLGPATGFRMEPVAGLLSARDFFGALRGGVFLSTQYIRHPSRPLYTPEPDIVHEAVGHAASLTDARIARVSRLFGAAAAAADDRQLERLNRAYWFTLEFGVVREAGAPRAFGAGLLSSAGELAGLATVPRLLPLDLERVAATPYDPTGMQTTLFVARGTDALLGELTTWLRGGGWR